MRKITLLTTVALTAGLTTAVLVAQPPGRGRGPGAGPGAGEGFGPDFDRLELMLEHRSERLAEVLELTDDQRAELDRLRASRLDAARPTLESLRATAEQLHALVESEAPDPAEVGEKVLAMHRMKQELRAEREGFEADLEILLTEEQRIAWDALRRARPGARGDRPFGPRSERRGPRHPRGPQGYGAPVENP